MLQPGTRGHDSFNKILSVSQGIWPRNAAGGNMSSFHLLATPQRRPKDADDKPYKCAYEGCSCSYYHSYALRRHERMKHGRKIKKKSPYMEAMLLAQAFTLDNGKSHPDGQHGSKDSGTSPLKPRTSVASEEADFQHHVQNEDPGSSKIQPCFSESFNVDDAGGSKALSDESRSSDLPHGEGSEESAVAEHMTGEGGPEEESQAPGEDEWNYDDHNEDLDEILDQNET